jgi:hypothetical protein
MKKRKPNILIIISDQQGIDTMAAYKEHFKHEAYLGHWLKTPNFDRMVAGGYSFLESHSTNPVCCPARSSLFTGRYSSETGVTYNNIGIDQQVPNMGEWFEQNSNYNRVYCGKWHAGGQWNYPDVEGDRKIPGFETIPVGVSGTGDFNDFQVAGALKGFSALLESGIKPGGEFSLLKLEKLLAGRSGKPSVRPCWVGNGACPPWFSIWQRPRKLSCSLRCSTNLMPSTRIRSSPSGKLSNLIAAKEV